MKKLLIGLISKVERSRVFPLAFVYLYIHSYPYVLLSKRKITMIIHKDKRIQ